MDIIDSFLHPKSIYICFQNSSQLSFKINRIEPLFL